MTSSFTAQFYSKGTSTTPQSRGVSAADSANESPMYVAGQTGGPCPSPWVSSWQLNPGSLELPHHHHPCLLETSLPNFVKSEEE